MFAHGLDVFVGIFYAVLFLVGIAGAIGLGFITHLFLRDAIRLGRERIPWLWILIIAAAFSGAAWYWAGSWGSLSGLPLLLFYGLGRWLGKRQAPTNSGDIL